MHLEPRLLRLAWQRRNILLLATILGVSAGGLSIVQAGILSRVINQVFLEKKTLGEVSGLCFFLLAVLAVRPALSWGSELAAQALARRVKSVLRRKLAARIEALGPIHISGEQTGELTLTFVEGVEMLDAYFSQYLPGIALAVFVPFAILLAVFQIDLLSGLVFLLTAPIIPVFMVLIGSLAQSLTRRQWGTLSRLSAYFLDVLQGLKTLKMFGRSQEQVKNVARASEQFRLATMRVLRVTFLSALTLEMAATLSTAVVAVQIGLRLLYAQIGFEQAFTVLLLAPEFYLPLRMLGARFHAGMAGVDAAQRIFQVLDRNPNLAEAQAASENSAAREGSAAAGAADVQFRRAIRFENVTVDYAEGRPALRGVRFEIQKGQQVALVGPSGSGKSTLAGLLLRFLQPGSGEIFVDGRSLDQIPAEKWRSIIAWVPQRPYLFDDTIEANIRLGKPQATWEELLQASRQAGAHEFIQKFSQGYQTRIGERGLRLSAGEAQRIALARAFLMDSELIILDEATANLDEETEHSLWEGINRLLENRTALIIAHRLNTIQKADQVLVIEDGEIRQAGPPGALAKAPGLYRQMLDHAARQIENPEERAQPNRMEAAWQPAQMKDQILPVQASPPDELAKAKSSPTITRLFRLAFGIWDSAALAVLAGAATVLSGVGLMATSAFIIASAALQPSIALLQVPIVGVRFFGIARGLFRYLERYLSHQATFQLLARLRVWFYQALEPLAPARLMNYRSGDLLTRILNDIQSLENFFVRALSPPLTALLALSAVFVFVASFDFRLGWILLVFWFAAGIGVPVLAGWAGKPLGTRLVEQRSSLNVQMVDFVQGLADLQAFNRSGAMMEILLEQGDTLAESQQRMSALSSAQAAATGLLSHLGMWGVLILAIPLVAAGRIDGVYLAVVVLAGLTSFEAVTALPVAAQYLENNLQAVRRLYEVVDAKPEVVDPARPLPMPEKFDLRVQDLSFRYPVGETALEHVTFDLPQGKRMAIVGASGAGKSTLVDLLLRFWEVQEGQILLDGQALSAYSQEALRARISIVPQHVYLFSASLRDNLRMAAPSASDEDIIQAATLAGIHSFIESLPQGYETWAGEQGLQLSAGERQRIAIARALLKPASVLILDEGTANLDAISEAAVIESILRTLQDRSLLMITHRLTAMDQMDEIIVMDGGAVVQRGRHAELVRVEGLYSRLWHSRGAGMPGLGKQLY